MSDNDAREGIEPNSLDGRAAPIYEDYADVVMNVVVAGANRPEVGHQDLTVRPALTAREEIEQARLSIRAGEYANAKAGLQRALEEAVARGGPSRRGTEGSALSLLGTAGSDPRPSRMSSVRSS